MGDSWEHDLRPSRPRDLAAGDAAFALHAAVGRCPPEDSGGFGGFDYLLDCLADPDCEDRADYVEWLGAEVWDQTADLVALAAGLGKLARKLAKHYR